MTKQVYGSNGTSLQNGSDKQDKDVGLLQPSFGETIRDVLVGCIIVAAIVVIFIIILFPLCQLIFKSDKGI